MEPQLSALMRTRFFLFLMKVFEELHPGQPPLAAAWYLKAIAYHLIEAADGRIPRLVITVPPRYLKSIAAAVALPAFLLGRNPGLKVMVASYSGELARQHAQQCRSIMESDWYRELFATRISERGNRTLELVTTAGGMRKAVSVGGTVTGFGADIIVIDDCMKAEDANSEAARRELLGWFDGTLSTRLNDKASGVIISIQQRLHEDDLPAYLLDKSYHHLNLPAIAERDEDVPIGNGRVHRRRVGELLNPARENQAVLDQLRRDYGPAVFEAQYQQNPAVPEGNLIRLHWFGTYEEEMPRSWYHRVVQSWDTASTASPTSDWSVCMTWGLREDRWYLLDVYRDRLEYPELKRAVIRLERDWRPDKVLIEQAGTGFSLAQDLRREFSGKFLAPRPTANKEERLIAQTAELSTGRFLLPREAAWLKVLHAELRVFPNGRHDDQVDSLSQFVNFQKQRAAYLYQEYTASGRPMHNRPAARFRARMGR